jgi:hypothetical protein
LSQQTVIGGTVSYLANTSYDEPKTATVFRTIKCPGEDSNSINFCNAFKVLEAHWSYLPATLPADDCLLECAQPLEA